MTAAISALQTLTTKFRRSISVMAVVALAFNPVMPLVSLIPAQAAPQTLFSDGFNDDSFDAWDTTAPSNWDTVSGNASEGTHRADAGSLSGQLTKVIDTTGFDNIKVTFDYKRTNFESDDTGVAVWSTGSSNFNLATFPGPGSGTDYTDTTWQSYDSSVVIGTLTDAADNPNFEIKFQSNTSQLAEEFKIDNVIVTGEPIDATAPSISLNRPPTPADNDTITADATWNIFDFTASDNMSDNEDLEAQASILPDNPARSDKISSWFNLPTSGTTDVQYPGTQIQSDTGMVDGETFDVQIEVRDEAGNSETVTVSNLTLSVPAAGPAPVVNSRTAEEFSDLQSAIDDSDTIGGDTLELNQNLTISDDVDITKQLTIDGNSYTVFSPFAETTNSNNSAFSIGGSGAGAVITDITLDGTGSTDLHGINAYITTNVTIDNATINNFRSGIVANGSTVTVNDITTSGNEWNAMNADLGSSVTAPSVLTVTGTSSHSETTSFGISGFVAHIWVDDSTKDVTVNDVSNQYNLNVLGNSHAYVLKTPVNTSDFEFIGSPKYVRANNGGDESARIVVSDRADAARFYINGSTTPITGQFVNQASADTERWKLETPLAPGEYDITAEVRIDSDWYDVNGSGTAYSLDSPTASYVLPNTNRQFFRPSDNPVRLLVEDEFEQFRRMVVEIDGNNYEVTRSQCDQRQAGNYLLCDVDASDDWSNLTAGDYTATTTTYTKANNRVDDLVSQEFTIDAEGPSLNELTLISHASQPVSGNVTLQAVASDNNGINNVEFYFAEPRDSDGQCDPTEPDIQTIIDTTEEAGYYTATFDTDELNGTYCFFAMAEDVAKSHSNPQSQKFSVVFDNTNPTITISDVLVSLDKELSFELEANDDGPAGLEIVAANIYDETNSTKLIELGAGGPPTRLNTPYSGLSQGTTTFDTSLSAIDVSGLVTGTYTIRAYAKDHAGNERRFELVQFEVDNTAPDLADLIATVNEDDTISATVTNPDGTAESVTFSVIDQSSSIIVAEVTDIDGSDGFSGETAPLPAGTYTVVANAVDASGNSTATGSGEQTTEVTIVEDDDDDGAVLGAGTGGPGGDDDPEPAGNETGPLAFAANTAGGQFAQVGGTADNGDVESETDDNTDLSDEDGETLQSTDDGDDADDTDNNTNDDDGLPWWWWLLIIAGVLGGLWLIAARRSREDE